MCIKEDIVRYEQVGDTNEYVFKTSTDHITLNYSQVRQFQEYCRQIMIEEELNEEYTW